MVNVTTGQPYCSLFIPPGYPQNLSPAAVTFNGVNSNCITGINEPGRAGSFQISPNAANGILNISFSGTQNPKKQIQIFNSIGKLLKEINFTQTTQISIAGLPNGLFFVKKK
jgi:hypothetical protein